VSYQIKSDRVVGDGNYLDPLVHKPPTGVLLQILTVDGVKIERAWSDHQHFVGWAPYPKKPEWVKEVVNNFNRISRFSVNINLSFVFSKLEDKGKYQKDFDIPKEYILEILDLALKKYDDGVLDNFNTLSRMWSVESIPSNGYWVSITINKMNENTYFKLVSLHNECVSQSKKYGINSNIDIQTFITYCIINYLNSVKPHI
jgi:hypothetical protein